MSTPEERAEFKQAELRRVQRLSGEMAGMVDALWRPLAHQLREYAAHLPSCAFLPDPTVSWTKCDCGFDAVLDAYDRLSAA